MNLLRLLAVAFSLMLMSGEIIRSWGVGRPIAFVLDDILMGLLLIIGAVLMKRPSSRTIALFVAGWAMLVGMLYGSFFNKVFAPEVMQSGNFSPAFLTWLVGLAFAVSLMGLIASISLTPPKTPHLAESA